MVRKLFILLLFFFSLNSCGVFFQTPFPGELIYFKDSVTVDNIPPFHYTELYTFDNYVFLYIDADEANSSENDKMYIFTSDLQLLTYSVSVDPLAFSYRCHTMATKTAVGSYIVGNNDFFLSNIVDNIVDTSNFIINNPPDQMPPDGFGFSDGVDNYIVWWDEGNNTLNYNQYTSGWGYNFGDAVYLSEYKELIGVYYSSDTTSPMVILVFSYDEENSRYVDVATVPVEFFANGLSGFIIFPMNFYLYSFRLNDIYPDECFFVGDGVVIYNSGVYHKYDMAGHKIKDLYMSNDTFSEAYSTDGKTRYIFSEKYLTLMKTDVWW